MGKKVIDITGCKFGMLTAIRLVDKPEGLMRTGKFWLVSCECGTEKIVYGVDLRSGKTKSCGCMKSSMSSNRMKSIQAEKYGTIEDRFLSGFIKNGEDECWEWVKTRDKDGYGNLTDHDFNVKAHRFSIKYFNGLDPKGFHVCHTCDNPSCVNPKHLFIGTARDNVCDMLIKSRDAMVGSRNNKAKLKESDVESILLSNAGVAELALLYGVSASTIFRIKSRKLWKHVNV